MQPLPARWTTPTPHRCQIEALSGTRDIILREQKQLTLALANLKAYLVRVAWALQCRHVVIPLTQ